MKLTTELIALCDYATVAQDGKLSINGIFDILRVPEFPGGIARVFFVTTIKGKPNENFKLSAKLEHTNDPKNLLKPVSVEGKISPNGKSNVIVQLFNVIFEKPGDHRFIFYDDSGEVGSFLLQVIHAPGQEQKSQIHVPN